VRVAPPATVVVFGALSAPLPAALRLTGDDVLPWGTLDARDLLVAHDPEAR
jgi:hypothetical protein